MWTIYLISDVKTLSSMLARETISSIQIVSFQVYLTSPHSVSHPGLRHRRKSKLRWEIRALTWSVLGTRDMTFVKRMLGTNSFGFHKIVFGFEISLTSI